MIQSGLAKMDRPTSRLNIWLWYAPRQIPLFCAQRTRLKRRKATFVHFGPVLAGGRLILASNDGIMRQFDPVTGNLLSSTPLPDGAARNPVVAGGTMYLVTENGQLNAYR